MQTFTTYIFGLALMLTASCQSSGHKRSGDPQGAAPGAAGPLTFNPFKGDRLEVSGSYRHDASRQDLYWALARCNCADDVAAAWLEKLSTSRGVLPQPLVPAIREQIRGDSKLQILDILPQGLSDLATDFFADDEKIATEIRSGIGEKLASFVPGGSRLGDRLPFRFDGFPSLHAESPDSFRIEDQIPRWHLVFGQDALWEGGSALGEDHGLQTLELMRTLVEWQYLLGIDENPEGGHYGGLTFDVKTGVSKVAGAFDPRKTPDAGRFLAGTAKINFPDGKAIDLATKVNESWSVRADRVDLADQARIWHTAAVAFRRLRPENRDEIRRMFGSGDSALFPNETHQLPLAYLPGLSALLSGPFLDKDARIIYQSAQFGNAPRSERADLKSLARLLGAMATWAQETENLARADLESSTRQSLSDGRDAMKKAAQLTAQNMINEKTGKANSFGLALHENNHPADIATAAEAITALIEAEQGLLDSPHLREQIRAMLHWLIGDQVALFVNEGNQLKDIDVLWLEKVLKSARPLMEERDRDWYTAATDLVEDAVAAWEDSAR